MIRIRKAKGFLYPFSHERWTLLEVTYLLFYTSTIRVIIIIIIMNRRSMIAIVLVFLVATYSGHGGTAFVFAPRQCGTILNSQVSSGRMTVPRSTTSSRLSMMNGPTSSTDPNDKSDIRTPYYYYMDEKDPPKKDPSSIVTAGDSPKAVKVRKQLQEVWTSPKTSPVLIIGPNGSGKGTLVQELLERMPESQKVHVHRLSMDDAADYCETMLGSENEPGLLDLMANDVNCTLVLKSFQSRAVQSADELSRRKELDEAIDRLVTQRSFYSRYEKAVKAFEPRIIATCSHRPEFVKDGTDVFVIHVPSLESRTKDMEAIAASKIKLLEGQYGLNNVQLSTQATHRLLDHRWEVVESELDEALGGALALLASEKRRDSRAPAVLASKHMFVNRFDESTRHRLLYEFPWLRRIIQSPWIFDHTLRYIVTPAFLVVLAILFLGPQTRDHNSVLTIFWAGWYVPQVYGNVLLRYSNWGEISNLILCSSHLRWPAVMLVYPFLGRIWCSICPFMAVGNLAQETVTRFGIKLKKWPKWASSIGPAFAFGLFFVILVWEELWNLPQNGALSAWLLLLITSGAVFNSVQFENRMWCRYLCPIGAMCRTFGTISMVEVRSWKANCEGCTNPVCVKGNSPTLDPNDAFAIKGCTMQVRVSRRRN